MNINLNMNLQIFSFPESIIFEKIKMTELRFGSVPYFYRNSYSLFLYEMIL